MKVIMKKTTVALFLFSSLFIMSACQKKSDFAESIPLRIAFGNYFRNERVTVKLDERIIFDDHLITWKMFNAKEGFTRSFYINAPIGMRTISVEIDGIKQTEGFQHEKDRIILISYYLASISIQATHEPILPPVFPGEGNDVLD